ncbi:MAG: hypothetical protein K0Q55_2124 [Verrucomicrobia bacterium]|nr:hypothetical protein [Verrucomicrobiota bacterium]
MKKPRPFLILLAVLVLLASPLFLYYLHDFIGLRNTVYSSPFTVERYSQVAVGVPRHTVVDLLGPPVQTRTLTNYPVWALRDEGVRQRYGTNAVLQIETLSFSFAKNGGDCDTVSVWIGPDNKVIQHERWVTD